MKTVDHSLKNAKQEIDRLSKTLPTEAGQANAPATQDTDQTSAPKREELVDAINQIFSLFRVNYHNQFYAAFNDSETLNQAKRMWLNATSRYAVETLLHSTRQLIENSEYLPTLHQFLAHCDQLQFALPTSHDAYIEACRAADSLASHNWSHPAVYHAGKATGWHFLRSQPEKQVFPVFNSQYDKQKATLRDGGSLPIPQFTALEQTPVEPLSNEEQKARLAKLKAELAL